MPIPYDDKPSRPAAIFGGILLLLMLSATLFETDAYRYASLLMAGFGLFAYARMEPKPKTSPLGWLCLLWSVYVLTRFAWYYFDTPNHEHGSSEWLFAFPMFFPAIGLGFVRLRFHIEKVLAVFFTAAAVLLAVSQHWGVIASGEPVIPLYHNNQIHGAVASGMILIAAFFWFLHYTEDHLRHSPYARLSMVLTPVIIVLAVISIIGSQSKGVWLALVVALPVAAVMVIAAQKRPHGRYAMLGLLAAVGLGIGIFHERLLARVAPIVDSVVNILENAGSSGNLAAYMQQQIASGTIPQTLNERLEIWYNALELFVKAPFFGHANMWIELWDHTRYADVGYTLMHNGYMEILIRQGLFGMGIFMIMVIAFIRMVYKGYRAGAVSLAGFQAYLVLLLFFMVTLLSNSNNRLAIGESFAMIWGGVAFYAEATLRYRRLLGREAPGPQTVEYSLGKAV